MRIKTRFISSMTLALFVLCGHHQLAKAAEYDQVSSTTVEVWTKAAVPSLSLIKSVVDKQTIGIGSTNSPGTEMRIEKSLDESFSKPTVLEDWAAHDDKDELTLTLSEDEETLYVRIQARNGDGTITEFSPPLQLNVALPQPVIEEESSTEDSITFTIAAVEGADRYKVKDADGKITDISENRIYSEEDLKPGQSYTFEYWVEKGKSVVSPQNSVTIQTKTPIVLDEPSIETQEITEETITFTLGKVEGADRYKVKALNGEIIDVSDTRTHTEENLEPGQSYTFTYWAEGGKYAASPHGSATLQTKTPTTLDEPTIEKHESTEKTITFTLSQVEGADRYKVKGLDGKVKDVSDTRTHTEENLEPGQSYAFTYWAEGGKYAASPYGSATLKTKETPKPDPDPEPKPEPKPDPDPSDTLGKPVVEKITVGIDNIAFTVSEVPGATTYKARRMGGPVADITKDRTYIENELQPGQAYPYEFWVEAVDKKSEVVNTTLYTKEADSSFNQNAKKIADALVFKADGVRNSSSAWIDVTLPSSVSAANYGITITIDGQEKQISATDFRFDRLMDNASYPVEVKITYRDSVYIKTVKVMTPNRTAPDPAKAYISNGKITLEVTSETELQKK